MYSNMLLWLCRFAFECSIYTQSSHGLLGTFMFAVHYNVWIIYKYDQLNFGKNRTFLIKSTKRKAKTLVKYYLLSLEPTIIQFRSTKTTLLIVLSFLDTIKRFLDISHLHLRQVLLQHVFRFGVLDQLRPEMSSTRPDVGARVDHHLAALRHDQLLELYRATHESLSSQPAKSWRVMKWWQGWHDLDINTLWWQSPQWPQCLLGWPHSSGKWNQQ